MRMKNVNLLTVSTLEILARTVRTPDRALLHTNKAGERHSVETDAREVPADQKACMRFPPNSPRQDQAYTIPGVIQGRKFTDRPRIRFSSFMDNVFLSRLFLGGYRGHASAPRASTRRTSSGRVRPAGPSRKKSVTVFVKAVFSVLHSITLAPLSLAR